MKHILKALFLCIIIISTQPIAAINEKKTISLPTQTIKNIALSTLLMSTTAVVDTLTYLYTHDIKKVAIASTLPLAIFIAYKLGKKTNNNTIQTDFVETPVAQDITMQGSQNQVTTLTDQQTQDQPVQQTDETQLLSEEVIIGQYLADQAQHDDPTTISHIVDQYIELTQKDH